MDRLVLYLGGEAWSRDRDTFERFGAAARTLREMSGGDDTAG